MDHDSDQATDGNDIVLVTTDGQSIVDAASSRSISRRHLIMGSALLAVSGIAVARAPKRRFPAVDDNTFNALFPKEFADWRVIPSSEMILPPESALAKKLYEHILTRSYANKAGDMVMFLVAYSSLQIDDVQLHRPEVCYRASGFQINDSQPLTLHINDRLTVPARVVKASQPLRDETILYWTRVGAHFPLAWAGQRWSMMVANLKGYYPDGALVRASVVNDGDRSVAVLTTFYRDLTKHCSPEAMRLLYDV